MITDPVTELEMAYLRNVLVVEFGSRVYIALRQHDLDEDFETEPFLDGRHLVNHSRKLRCACGARSDLVYDQEAGFTYRQTLDDVRSPRRMVVRAKAHLPEPPCEHWVCVAGEGWAA